MTIDPNNEPGHVRRRIEEEEVTAAEPRPPADAYDEEVVDRRSRVWYDDIRDRTATLLVAFLAAIEALLVLRFLLRAFGASRASGFVRFVMDVSWPFARPFANAFANRTWNQGVVEVSTLLAIAVWLVIFGLLALVLAAVGPSWRGGGGTYVGRRRLRQM